MTKKNTPLFRGGINNPFIHMIMQLICLIKSLKTYYILFYIIVKGYKYRVFIPVVSTPLTTKMFATNNGASECSKSELDLFSIAPTQTSIESNCYTRVNPQTALTNNTAPIEFNITGSAEHFIDLTNIFIYVGFRIRKHTGA